MKKRNLLPILLSTLASLALVMAGLCTLAPQNRFKAQASTQLTETVVYESSFSTASEQTAVPSGWVRHNNQKTGTAFVKDGALWLDCLNVTSPNNSVILYNGLTSNNYSIEAKLTMVQRQNDNRWMGLVYRTKADVYAWNAFVVKASDYMGDTGYYGITDITGSKGWNGGQPSGMTAVSYKTTHPSLVGKGITEGITMKIVVIDGTITAFLNGTQVAEYAIPHYSNGFFHDGYVGLCTGSAVVKYENVKITQFPATAVEPDEPDEPEPDTPALPQTRDDAFYKSSFSTSATRVDEMPTDWKRGTYRNGSVYQQNGALWLDSYDANNISTVMFTQGVSTDYMIEADLTMVSRRNDTRWMGLVFRSPYDVRAWNAFVIKADNNVNCSGYYGITDITGATGWEGGGTSVYPSTSIAQAHPNLVDCVKKGTIRMRVAVIDNTLYAWINEEFITTFTVPYPEFFTGGYVGIASSGTLCKVENVEVTSFGELTAQTGEVVSVVPQNYVASATVGFASTAASTATASFTLASSATARVVATVTKSGQVTVARVTDAGTQTLLESNATIANPSSFAFGATAVNGAYRLSINGKAVGSALCFDEVTSAFTFASDSATATDIEVCKTTPVVEGIALDIAVPTIPFGGTPDWSSIALDFVLSNGTTQAQTVTSDMISGLNVQEEGIQYVALTYYANGKQYVHEFPVTVGINTASSAKIRVGIISDIHIGADASNPSAFITALQYYKAKGADLIVGVGDMAHNTMDYLNEFNRLYETVFPHNDASSPELLLVMGNHDTYAFEALGYARNTAAHNNALEDYFANTFSISSDYGRVGLNYYKIVNGYVFVGLYINTPIAERADIIAKAFALPEAQGKPVFIVEHEHPIGTTYVATDTSSNDTEIHNVLANYPNAVMLVGHAHNPLADERAIWQGEYTVVTCGALFGPIVEANMYEGGREQGSFPDNNWTAKSALYMEVFEDKATIVRYNFTDHERLGKDWTLNWTANGSDIDMDLTQYNYELRKAAAVAPEFATDATVTATPRSESVITISFPAATTVYENQDDIIQSYIIRAYNNTSGKLIATKRILTKHYLARGVDLDSHTLDFTGLNARTEYRFEVTAAESYQKEGKALTVIADTKAFATDAPNADVYADFNYAWDMDLFDTYVHDAPKSVTLANNALSMDAATSSKAILKNFNFLNGSIETMISLNGTNTLLSAGVYLFTSNPASHMDAINALNVHLDSAIDSTNLSINIYSFNGSYNGNLASVTLSNYFTSTTSKTVALSITVSNGVISVYLDEMLALSYNAGTKAVSGAIGFRSHFCGAQFDYLRVYESSVNYVAPDAAKVSALQAMFTEADSLLSSTVTTEVTQTLCNTYTVPQTAFSALKEIADINTGDPILFEYDRHINHITPLLTQALAEFKAGMVLGTAHEYGAWEQTSAPSCNRVGEERRDCAHCDAYETNELPQSTEHDFGDWVQTVAPNCDHAGEERRDCNVCDAYETNELPQHQEHGNTQWIEVIPPTVETLGQEHLVCDVCGDTLDTRDIPKLQKSGCGGNATAPVLFVAMLALATASALIVSKKRSMR